MIYLILFGAVLFCFLLIYMTIEAFQNRVLFHTFTFSSFPKGCKQLTLFFISDIHRRKINPTIINETNGKVDIVVIGGDLLERGVPFERVEYNLAQLKKLGPIFFVWGNNDYEVEEEKLIALLRKYDVKLLRNSAEILWTDKNEKIALVGVDDISQERDDLFTAMEHIDYSYFQILISHNPNIIYKMYQIDTISLVISGHTHGGQIHIFGYSPYKKGGIYKHSNTIQLISNGYGTSLLPLRLGAKPETHIITLKRRG